MAHGTLASQCQSFLAVEPVRELMVRAPALALEQYMDAPVAVAHTRVRDLPNPCTQFRTRVPGNCGRDSSSTCTSPPRTLAVRSPRGASPCTGSCVGDPRASPISLPGSAQARRTPSSSGKTSAPKPQPCGSGPPPAFLPLPPSTPTRSARPKIASSSRQDPPSVKVNLAGKLSFNSDQFTGSPSATRWRGVSTNAHL